MKTRTVATAFCLFLISSFSVSLQAQENLDALRKKYEKSGQSQIQVVNNDGKKKVNEIFDITITNNKKIVDEFLDAFNKDSNKEGSKTVIRRKGAVVERNLTQDSDSTLLMYRIVSNDEANATIHYRKIGLDATMRGPFLEIVGERTAINLPPELEYAKSNTELTEEQAKNYMEFLKKEEDKNLEQAIKKNKDSNDKKVKFMIPVGSYMIINGAKVTAEQARHLGYDVEEF